MTREKHDANDYETGLFLATCNGHTATMEILLQAGTEANTRDDKGELMINIATDNGDRKAIEILLQAGACVNQKCREWGRTPLINASMRGHTEIIKFLLDQGADLTQVCSYGRTALYMAVYCGHLETVKFLVSVGANINCKDTSQCWTPVIEAAYSGDTEMVKFLCQAGADLTPDRKELTRLNAGITPLMAAVQGYTEEIVSGYSIFENPEYFGTIKVLLNAGVNVDFGGFNSPSPVVYAAQRGQSKMVEFLSQAGADLTKVNFFISIISLKKARGTEEGELLYGVHPRKIRIYTPMTAAIKSQRGYVETIKRLLNLGVDINQVVPYYDGVTYLLTALYFALMHHNAQKSHEIVKLLLSSGADIRFNVVETGSVTFHLMSVMDWVIRKGFKRKGYELNMAPLYAAGAVFHGPQDNKDIYRSIIPDFIIDDQKPMLFLAGLCRIQIRVTLLSEIGGNQKNLYSAVPQLPLPKRLKQFLLFDVTIE